MEALERTGESGWGVRVLLREAAVITCVWHSREALHARREAGSADVREVFEETLLVIEDLHESHGLREFHRLSINAQERADVVHVGSYVAHQLDGAGGQVAERTPGDRAA